MVDAAAHDSRVFGGLPDRTPDENGNKRAVYADSAHRSKATEEKPAQNDVVGRIRGKGTRAAARARCGSEALIGTRMAGQARPQWRNAAKCGGNRPG